MHPPDTRKGDKRSLKRQSGLEGIFDVGMAQAGFLLILRIRLIVWMSAETSRPPIITAGLQVTVCFRQCEHC
jgi:hypothetical protein